ncbi:segregation/condensation protein A [Methanosarcinales archaeon]|nr:MAG: segregation/condensation protein A [Methanosarcinales archaeon]
MLFQDPVEILLDMAKKGKINPWDIDIVEVTDKFLKELERMRILNLRVSARTLLYASMLVKMKSDILAYDDFSDADETDLIGTDLMNIPETPMLDDYPVPKIPLRRMSKRKVTLDELIEELRKVEAESCGLVRKGGVREMERRKGGREKGGEGAYKVIELAYEDDIRKVVEKVEHALVNMPVSKISFSELLNEVGDISKVLVYVSLLFLATDGKIVLRQRRFFGELHIVKVM